VRDETRGAPVSASSAVAARTPWYFNDYLVLVFRIVLAAVFIYAAMQKIGKPLAFADEIRMYRIVGIGAPLYIMAIVLPWIELLCGLSLLTGLLMRGSALILFVFNAVFIVAVSIRTVGIMGEEGIGFMSVYFDCGCGFGATHAWKKLLEDIIFFLLSLVILLKPGYRFVLRISRRSP
jgi:uncharacterized membrane protein YphA (DoxX/SURF4 family)